MNAIFRIGDTMVARFLLQHGEVESTGRWLEPEAAAARELLRRSTFRTPQPIGIGDLITGYPLPWSVPT